MPSIRRDRLLVPDLSVYWVAGGKTFGGMLALSIAVAFLAACRGADEAGSQGQDAATIQRQLSDARSYKKFTPQWAGRAFDELPLTRAERSPAPGDTIWSFAYGECSPHPEGCSYAIDIANFDVCKHWIKRPDKRGALFPFRGAQATFDRFQRILTIYTGRTAVAINGDRPEAFGLARALRPVGEESGVHRLRPPARGSMRGRLPCQQGPRN